MADRERKGLVARWLEGKERSEDYARSTLPSNRWQLFWDIMKGRFGRLMLVNLLTLITFIPIILVFIWRLMTNTAQNIMGPYGSGLGVGYPVIPNLVGTPMMAEWIAIQNDLLFFALFIVGGLIAAVGISGGMYIIRNLIWTEGIFVANDFVRGIRRNFWNVAEAVFLFTLTLFIAQTMGNLADWLIAMDTAPGWMLASKIVGYVLVALMGLISLWMISLGINYKQGPWALFRNAVVMTVGTLPQTIFFAVLAFIPVALLFTGVSFLVTIAVLVMILFGLSYVMLVWMDYSQWAFDKFINPNLGVKTGRGLYSRDPKEDKIGGRAAAEEGSEAVREYRRMILAQGKSKLVSRPIKPLDDELEVYQLPESFSREDLRRLKESKDAINEDVKAYEEEHKDDEQYVEYNRQFEELERALQDDGDKKKKKKKKLKKAPKMLNKH